MYASMRNTAAENAATPFTLVAVAAIVNEHQQVLVSLRPDHVHQGGLWEFPGGKIGDGESPEQALERELSEELGVELGAADRFMHLEHSATALSLMRKLKQAFDPAGILNPGHVL